MAARSGGVAHALLGSVERSGRCRAPAWRSTGASSRRSTTASRTQAEGGCVSLPGGRDAEVPLYQRGERADATPLLDHSLPALSDQEPLHAREGASDRRGTGAALAMPYADSEAMQL